MHEDASRARPRGPVIGEPRVPSLTMLDGRPTAPCGPEQQSARSLAMLGAPRMSRYRKRRTRVVAHSDGRPRLPLRSRSGDVRSGRSSSVGAPARSRPAGCDRALDPTTGRDLAVARVPVPHPPGECRHKVNSEVRGAAVVRLPGHHPAPSPIDPERRSGRGAVGRTPQPR
jgi:hypothetical protein